MGKDGFVFPYTARKHRLMVSINDRELKQWREVAEAFGARSMSDFIRIAVNAAITNHRKGGLHE